MYWNSVDFAEVYLDIGGCMALDICCYSDVGIYMYLTAYALRNVHSWRLKEQDQMC